MKKSMVPVRMKTKSRGRHPCSKKTNMRIYVLTEPKKSKFKAKNIMNTII